ncbi:hypothetical protein GCM10009760_33810 [Kitasatospora kazusensis]|uniref:AB hydrolase-1 domain-containing protein n=1 Tax=Kitasatospora kazusensis TaxID=407974 RepID=A0ABP5LG62_9ACTN
MSTFVLVPGACLGAWAWEAVAADLAARGHRAVPLTLAGLAERAGADGPEPELLTHIAEIEAAIDAEYAEDAEPVVLVAHSYGIFPALAAADRLPSRVSRVVFVDCPIPEDGESALDQLFQADPVRHAEVGEHGLSVGPIAELLASGMLAGVPEAEAARYERLATTHPRLTLSQPVPLTGAWRVLPTTGVFCLGNGLSIELARALHATGAPRFAKLAEPGVTFFELPTGHHPMLSMPAELTDVLVRAAAGEGRGLHD